MEPSEVETAEGWVPQACTLPTAERPVRVAEFDALWTESVRGVERVEPQRLRLWLRATPPTAGRAAELMTRETGCCSFFTFALTATGGRLSLEISVPSQHVKVLDALAARAAATTNPATVNPTVTNPAITSPVMTSPRGPER